MSNKKGIFNLNLQEDSHQHKAVERVVKKAKKQDQTRMNVMVDSVKLTDFKLTAMKQGKTMSEEVNRYIDNYLKTHKE